VRWAMGCLVGSQGMRSCGLICIFEPVHASIRLFIFNFFFIYLRNTYIYKKMSKIMCIQTGPAPGALYTLPRSHRNVLALWYAVL